MQMKAFVNMDQMAENTPLRVYLYDAFMGIAQLKGSSIVFRAMVGGGINDMQYA
jgi:hypothetical protein